MGKLFGTDGIRGVANAYPMDVDTAMAAGRATARFFKNEPTNTRQSILIGWDTRRSGTMLAHAVSAGICAEGMDVQLLGVVPTPAVAQLTRQFKAAAGIVISASHNPFADNGIKLFNSNGCKLSDDEEAAIERLILGDAVEESKPVASDEIGVVDSEQKALDRYLDFLVHSMGNFSLSGCAIVLDCANGATFQAAPALFERLEAKVTPLFCDPNGININDRCGSQHPEILARTVKSEGADIGLAFDGDGDRLIAVDEKGTVLTGDQIIAICANHLNHLGNLKEKQVVTTVMSNMGLKKALSQMGIALHTSAVGDRNVMQMMVVQDATLGGEDSGHIIFRDHHTTGDGMMAALRLLDAMQTSGKPLSALSKIMDVFPQELINVDVREKPPLASIPEIMDAIRSAEKALGDEGRVLVRYSGTQNKCRVMVEGPTEQSTRHHCQAIAHVIGNVLGD